MKEILRFEQVSYAYEEHRNALSDCSVAIHAGEKIAVLGNNGAGKSTFFLLANGVLTPKSGRVMFKEVPVGKRAKERNRLRRGVGLVFQDPDVQLLAGTVEEEISFGPMNLRLPKDEVRRRVDEAIARLHLEDFRLRPPQYLSGGEKKRVSIADVLAMEPELMLLDEPAAGLDPANNRLLERNLEMLEQQGLALAVATHDVNFAWQWASRILVFHDGHLVADDVPEVIFADTPLLERCHLEQPLLYQVGELLGLPRPRTMQELEQLLHETKDTQRGAKA